jgi:hypothetical protein
LAWSPRDVIDYSFAFADARLCGVSLDAARIVAVLAMPDPKVETALDLARKVGTLDKVDRRPQYSDPKKNAQPEALLEAVNAQGNHIRGLQSDTGKMQRQLYNLKLRNSVVVAASTALLMNAPAIARFVWAWFR